MLTTGERRVKGVFEPETATFLESGCALIVGTVDAHGTPHAARGWGLDVSLGGGTARLLLDSADTLAAAALAATGAIAVTGCDVPTLRSIQLKGRAGTPVAADNDGISRADRYCSEFFDSVEATDGTPRALLERLRPSAYLVCDIEVDEVFDQTPGPGAGAPIAPAP